MEAYDKEKISKSELISILDEKIRILKREGRNYSIDTFETLMDVVNRRNIISLNLSEVDYSHIEHLRKIIDKNIEDNKVNKVNKVNKFQTLLYGLLNTYELALEKQTDEMKNMKKIHFDIRVYF